MRFALLAVLALTTAGTAHAGNAGILIPPVEVDLGVGVPVGPAAEDLSPSMEILAGVHWASLAWKPTQFDVGAGYVGSQRHVHDGDSISMHGGYLTLATTLAKQKHFRTWLAARGELLHVSSGDRDMSALGASLRIATEVFGSGAGGGRNALVVGTIAVGFYVEATYRDVPADMGPVGVASGVTCRLPFVVAGG